MLFISIYILQYLKKYLKNFNKIIHFLDFYLYNKKPLLILFLYLEDSDHKVLISFISYKYYECTYKRQIF